MATRMQQRRGTSEQWNLANPVLAEGELGWESDTNQFKIGDGINNWSLLPYFLDESSLAGSLDDYVPVTSIGAADGVASLDENGQVPASQLQNATVDLTGYATESYVDQAELDAVSTANAYTDSEIAAIPAVDLTGYATETYVDNAIAAIPEVDLTGYATETYVNSAVAGIVDAAPEALNTLNELAAALGDDENFATTVTTALSGKANTSHTHSISNVSGLQSALDGKMPLYPNSTVRIDTVSPAPHIVGSSGLDNEIPFRITASYNSSYAADATAVAFYKQDDLVDPDPGVELASIGLDGAVKANDFSRRVVGEYTPDSYSTAGYNYAGTGEFTFQILESWASITEIDSTVGNIVFLTGTQYSGSFNIDNIALEILSVTSGSMSLGAAAGSSSSDATTIDNWMSANNFYISWMGPTQPTINQDFYKSVVQEVAGKAPLNQSVRTLVADYNLLPSDSGKVILGDADSANTITVYFEPGSLPVGARVDFVKVAGSSVNFSSLSGTISSKDGELSLTSNYAAATLICTSADSAILIGDLG